MEIRLRTRGEHKIVEIDGDIDYFSVGELKNSIFALINDRVRSIILDLKDVEYMDSSGIGLIVTAFKVMNGYGGRIALVHVQEDILALLKLATVDSIMKIYESANDIE
ncbi:MAG: STAS domain-containing protein [Spirochaetes bacterium]|nr:STAS domain-containing protein [Spirochaetota bacterium]